MCRDPDTERKGIVPIGFLDLYVDDDEDEPREQNTTGASSQEVRYRRFGNFAKKRLLEKLINFGSRI